MLIQINKMTQICETTIGTKYKLNQASFSIHDPDKWDLLILTNNNSYPNMLNVKLIQMIFHLKG